MPAVAGFLMTVWPRAQKPGIVLWLWLKRLMNMLIGNERELKRAVDDGADMHASAVSAFEYGDVA